MNGEEDLKDVIQSDGGECCTFGSTRGHVLFRPTNLVATGDVYAQMLGERVTPHAHLSLTRTR